ncbi:MAG: GUN4 domain-containing protein [Richelia sp. RM2_1_2]|nr:GUN4 domain-containing protein [Richelia sp. RM2_1_2]
MKLSGKQLEKLEKALIEAFPDKVSLERMLTYQLDKHLSSIVGEGSLQDVVFKLIQTANTEGWVENLVRAARKQNPGNSELKAIATELLTPEKSLLHNVNNAREANKELQTNKQNDLDEIAVIGDEASEVGADYTKLRDLLRRKNFVLADKETVDKVLWIVKREKYGWLNNGECMNDENILPSKDLITIDKLWLAASKGKYGFSVQKKLWIDLGGNPDFMLDCEKNDWEKMRQAANIFQHFCNKVKWKEEEITYDLRAEKGHLPLGLYATVRGDRIFQVWSKIVFGEMEKEIGENKMEIERLKNIIVREGNKNNRERRRDKDNYYPSKDRDQCFEKDQTLDQREWFDWNLEYLYLLSRSDF